MTVAQVARMVARVGLEAPVARVAPDLMAMATARMTLVMVACRLPVVGVGTTVALAAPVAMTMRCARCLTLPPSRPARPR